MALVGAEEMTYEHIRQIRPEQVDPVYRTLGQDGPPPFKPLAALGRALALLLRGNARRLREISDSLAGSVGWLLNARYGYGSREPVTYKGDPSASSPELGRAIRETMVQGCLEYVERVTGGQMSSEEVRSIASAPPFHSARLLATPGFGMAVAGVSLLWWTTCVRTRSAIQAS